MGLFGDPNAPLVDPFREAKATDAFKPSTSDVAGIFVDELLLERGPLATLIDATTMSAAGGKRISEEEFQASPNFRKDINFFEGMTDTQLRLLREMKEEEARAAFILSKATTTQKVFGFTAGLASAFLDPVNVLTAFIPIPGVTTGKVAGQLTKVQRLKRGAAEGAFGSALVEPVFLATEDTLQRDNTFGDSLGNIAIGAFVGSGLHLGVGAFSDFRAGRIKMSDHIEIQEISNNQMIEGKHVDVEPVIAEKQLKVRRQDDVIDADPLDPRTSFDAEKASLRAEPAKLFKLGEPTGTGKTAKFRNYTKISTQDAKFIGAINAEVQTSTPGSRIFLDDPEGPGQVVIGTKSDAPDFFQSFNKEIDAEKKARSKIIKENQKLPPDKQKPLPTARSAISKEQIDTAARKMIDGEPLGVNEGRIAEMLFAESRARREANVSDMLEFRANRQRENVEIETKAGKRQEEGERMIARQDDVDSFSASDPVAIRDTDIYLEDNPNMAVEDAELDLEIAELDAEMREFAALEGLDIADEDAIARNVELVKEAEIVAKASKTSVTCMKGDPE